jgi:hypothetical protein
VREGDLIDFGSGVGAVAGARGSDGSLSLRFEGEEPVEQLLQRAGRMPLPPYIAGKRPTDERDSSDYQTMFAREGGAVAAPTAALHFTPGLMASLRPQGIRHETLTLHVGAGTFLPMKSEDTDDHVMHSEWGRIDDPRPSAERCAAAGRAGDRRRDDVAPLARNARTREREVQAFEGDTDIFITPWLSLPAVDGLITNFHLPRSTLFMRSRRLMGLETMKAHMRMRFERTTASTPMATQACFSPPRASSGSDRTPPFLLLHLRNRWRRPLRHGLHDAGRDPHTRLHAGRHCGHSEGDEARRRAGGRSRYHPRQYLPSDASPQCGASGAARGLHRFMGLGRGRSSPTAEAIR